MCIYIYTVCTCIFVTSLFNNTKSSQIAGFAFHVECNPRRRNLFNSKSLWYIVGSFFGRCIVSTPAFATGLPDVLLTGLAHAAHDSAPNFFLVA